MSTATTEMSDVTALREMAAEFEAGFNSGDVDRMMRFYGATYVDVNLRHPVQTHDERRAYYLAVMSRVKVRVQVQPGEIVVLGDLALVRGGILLTKEDCSVMELRYLEVSRKTPDGWKAIWGMDGPVQEFDSSQS